MQELLSPKQCGITFTTFICSIWGITFASIQVVKLLFFCKIYAIETNFEMNVGVNSDASSKIVCLVLWLLSCKF